MDSSGKGESPAQGAQDGRSGNEEWVAMLASDKGGVSGFAMDHPPVGMEMTYDDGGVAPARRGSLLLAISMVTLAALWVAFVLWTLSAHGLAVGTPPALTDIAAAILPVLLLALIWMVARVQRPNPVAMIEGFAQRVTGQASQSLTNLAQAEARLASACAAFDAQMRSVTEAAEAGSGDLLAIVARAETQSARLNGMLRESGDVATHTLSLLAAVEEATPRAETRLGELAGSLDRNAVILAERGEALERQFREATNVAEHTQIQLHSAQGATLAHLKKLSAGAREAGDELTAIADLASARFELTVERARSGINATNEALERRLTALESLGGEGERTAQLIDALGITITGLGQKLAALESEAQMRTHRIGDGIESVMGDADRLGGALEHGNETAGTLIARAETLLLALDSNIREIDESLPSALDRFEGRLGTTRGKLDETTMLVEGMANTATGIATRLEQASEAMVAQTAMIESTIASGDVHLARQSADVQAILATLQDSSAIVDAMNENAGPRMLARLEQLRAAADAAAQDSRAAIDRVIAQAATELGQASGVAMEAAVGEKVNTQLAQIAEIADNAVKSAHRATDHLMRQMMALSDSAVHFETRIASAQQADDGRNRDYLTERSAQIIAALNDSAIDVAKCLNHEVGEREWASYLNGDKSLFARRAVKLLSGGEVKRVHVLYDEDVRFRELVNRYVDEFEAMLRDILAGRNGHALAITMLSSDVGKLYVALAQAIERIRVA